MILRRRAPTDDETEAAVQAAELIEATGREAVLDADIDWPRLRAESGGFDAAYERAALAYDGFAIIPNLITGTVGRGQYTIATCAINNGKPVVCWQSGSLHRVSHLQIENEEDWKTTYARPIMRKG
jgi:hypothetical protein